MPAFGSSSGSNNNTGRGGFHPGVGPQDTSSSAASGSIGTATVSGAGDTIANTTSSSVSGQRVTLDPFHNGPITYSVSAGSLPPGFSLNASTGVISGTYTASGINTDGQVYSFTIRASDNSPGAKSTSDRSYTVTLSVPWLYRQIITTMYMAGGYASSVAWSNVNRFPRATETCADLGNGNIDTFNYKSGMCSDNAGYIWGAGGGHNVDLNTTSKFNLRTETKGSNPGGPGFSASDTGTAFAPDRNRAYVTGDGISNMFRFTASSESYATLGGGQGGHACSVSGENKGIYWGDANRSINFSTEAQATISMAGGAHGQQKGLSAKTGFGYGGNEGTYAGGFNYRKINITNESYGTITKPWPNCGEENHAMSQDRGYMIGQYDDSIGQNNRCGRIIYATDAAAQLATTVQGRNPGVSGQDPHTGASSGHCFWRD